MTLVEKIKARARAHLQRIVLPEGEDPRIVTAAAAITREGFAKVTLLGRKQIIGSVAADLHVALGDVAIVDPAASPRAEAYAQIYYDRRRSRGVSLEEAREIARRPLYFAALSVAAGDADGTVGGAANTTGETVRAALHAIGLAPEAKLVSSFFVMIIPARPGLDLGPGGALLFADCAVVPDPNPEELAEIARATAENARAILDAEPRVAFLSFSTKASANHARVEKVREALRILKARAPEIAADGELQADAALVPRVANSKAPGSPVAGHANVLIFPGPGLRQHRVQTGGEAGRRAGARPDSARAGPAGERSFARLLGGGCRQRRGIHGAAGDCAKRKVFGTTDAHR